MESNNNNSNNVLQVLDEVNAENCILWIAFKDEKKQHWWTWCANDKGSGTE